MTRRFTETGKWDDKQFRRLSLAAKVLLQLLNDKCDVAGFWQVDMETTAFFTGLPEKEDLSLGQPTGESSEGALEELTRIPKGAEFPVAMLSEDRSWLYLIDFLPHQGNWPLPANPNLITGIKRAFAARNSFGEQALTVLCRKTQQLIPQDFFDSPLTVNRESKDSPGKGKGNGKGSPMEGGCKGETIKFDYATGQFTGTESTLAEWEAAYPHIDAAQETRKAGAWLMANRDKPKRRFARFLVNWLARAEQDATRSEDRAGRVRADGASWGQGGILLPEEPTPQAAIDCLDEYYQHKKETLSA